MTRIIDNYQIFYLDFSLYNPLVSDISQYT